MVPYCRIPSALKAPFSLKCVQRIARNGSGTPQPDTIGFYAALRGGTRFSVLEQVRVRGIFRRKMRLELIAGLGIALAMPALAASSAATTTTLTAGTLSGCTQPLALTVLAGSSPATGTVTIDDVFNGETVQLGSTTLSAKGAASPSVSLLTGDHVLTATYAGSSAYESSSSSSVAVSVTAECDFMPAIANITPATTPANTLTAGKSGTAKVSIPLWSSYTDQLKEPAFITLSCSNVPDTVTCSFTPQDVEIQPGQDTAATSTMVIQTSAASTSSSLSPANRRSAPIAWAFLLPGALGLGGLAWGARRRRWLRRLSLVAMVGLVTLLGTTACNPLYGYKNHKPNPVSGTPAGSYTVNVTAQFTDGVTATTRSTVFALTVE